MSEKANALGKAKCILDPCNILVKNHPETKRVRVQGVDVERNLQKARRYEEGTLEYWKKRLKNKGTEKKSNQLTARQQAVDWEVKNTENSHAKSKQSIARE